MGLDIKATGLSREKEWHGSYGRFMNYRILIAKSYNRIFGNRYEKVFRTIPISNEEAKWQFEEADRLYEELTEKERLGLQLFLFSSDCEGQFSPKQCRMIYNELSTLEVKNVADVTENMSHARYLNILIHCMSRRVIMKYR